MTGDDRYQILFEPVQVGPKAMRNRFYKVPHCSGFGAERPGAQAGRRGMGAEGGWAVVNTESCSVHPSTDEFPLNSGRMWDAEDASNYKLMVDTAYTLVFDVLVLVTQRNSDNTLYRDLMAARDQWEAGGIQRVLRIGDCVAPGLIADAVFDGHRLAREIDTDAPETPRAFLRERPVVGMNAFEESVKVA